MLAMVEEGKKEKERKEGREEGSEQEMKTS